MFVDGEMGRWGVKVGATHGGWRYSLQLLEKKATATCGIAKSVSICREGFIDNEALVWCGAKRDWLALQAAQPPLPL